MAPNIPLQRADSSRGRRRHLHLSTLSKYIQEARIKQAESTGNSANMSPLTSLSELSLALDDSSTQTGISSNETDVHNAKGKGVRFNTKISIVEIPEEQARAARVSFSDEVIDIDTVVSRSPSPTPSPPRKQVRFGCLKKKGLRHFSHTPIYKMNSFDAISPLLKPKKRVRFGCLKGDSPPSLSRSSAGVWDLSADEAATFKRSREGLDFADEVESAE